MDDQLNERINECTSWPGDTPVDWIRRHWRPDTGLELRSLAVWHSDLGTPAVSHRGLSYVIRWNDLEKSPLIKPVALHHDKTDGQLSQTKWCITPLNCLRISTLNPASTWKWLFLFPLVISQIISFLFLSGILTKMRVEFCHNSAKLSDNLNFKPCVDVKK